MSNLPDSHYTSEGRTGKVLFALSALLILLAVIFPMHDFDTHWHLANGRTMFEEGRIVKEELFSYTALGKQFNNKEWLSQYALYLVYHLGGQDGLLAFKVAMTLLTAYLFYRAARLSGGGMAVSSVLVLSAVLAGLNRYVERPELFTLVFLGLMVYLHYSVRAGEISWKWLWVLPPVVLAWDVAHYGFMMAFVCYGSLVASEVARYLYLKYTAPEHDLQAERGKVLGYFYVLLAIAGVSLLNPSYGAYMEIAKGKDLMMLVIEEFQPLKLGELWGFWALLAASAALALLLIRRADARHLFLLVPFAAMALKYNRATALFALMSVPALAHYIGIIGSMLRTSRARPAVLWLPVAVLCALSVYVYDLKFGSLKSPYRFGFGINEEMLPVAPVRFLKEAGPKGNIYNNGMYGGYLAFTMYPEVKIFQYNLLAFSPVMSRTQSRAFLEEYKIAYALVNYQSFWVQAVLAGQDWVPVFWHSNMAVYVRNAEPNKAMVARYGLRYHKPGTSVAALERWAQSDPVGVMREAAQVLGYAHNPALAGLLVRLLLETPIDPQNGLALANSASKYNQDSAGLWAARGYFEYRLGRKADAEALLLRATAMDPTLTSAHTTLGYVYYDLGRIEEALVEFTSAIAKSDKVPPAAYYGRALCHLKKSDRSAAAADLETFLKLQPTGSWAERAREMLKGMGRV